MTLIIMKIDTMVKNFFLMLYYAACGKPSKYRKREDQVADAFWLVSMLQGINLISLLMISFVTFSYYISSRTLLFAIALTPLAINYFIFFKKGKEKIINITDELIRLNKLMPRLYVVGYAVFTIILMVISATLYGHYK